MKEKFKNFNGSYCVHSLVLCTVTDSHCRHVDFFSYLGRKAVGGERFWFYLGGEHSLPMGCQSMTQEGGKLSYFLQDFGAKFGRGNGVHLVVFSQN